MLGSKKAFVTAIFAMGALAGSGCVSLSDHDRLEHQEELSSEHHECMMQMREAQQEQVGQPGASTAEMSKKPGDMKCMMQMKPAATDASTAKEHEHSPEAEAREHSPEPTPADH